MLVTDRRRVNAPAAIVGGEILTSAWLVVRHQWDRNNPAGRRLGVVP